ncbi:MAG TPA: late competence development ComFB family protein [Gemmatimonadales bacterium]|nr:late competence development ComFB family protein [Gemmatimonadales bacterium]
MIRNLAEEHVTASYEALRRHFPGFCGCDVCREDVLVFALNRVRPRYVTSLEGSVVTEVNLEKEESRAPIDVAVMEGLRKIARAPRCAARGSARPS